VEWTFLAQDSKPVAGCFEHWTNFRMP